jgi:hypothetical protein
MAGIALDEKVGHADLVAFGNARVNLKEADVSDYRAQVNRLKDKLEAYIAGHPSFDLEKMRNSGSVAKGTALRTINDMDLAVYVRASHAPVSDPDLIAWMESLLREAYGNILRADQFEAKHHCVTISFRGTGLDVDIVPVLYEGEENDYGCLITKDTGERVRTSVPLHLEFIRTRKKAQPTHFAQMVRFVKWWARRRKAADPSFRFKSFMAELVMAHLADGGLDCSNYPEALETFFAFLVQTQLKSPIAFSDYASAGKPNPDDASPIRIYDPVNAQNNVARRYSELDRRSIVEAATDALDAVTWARSAPTKATAIERWREVFGSGFGA